MVTVTLRYGTKRLSDLTVDRGTTIATIVENFGPALGLPESVQALADNEPVDSDYEVQEGDNISFEKQACKKA